MSARIAQIAALLQTGTVLPNEHREYLCDAFKSILDGKPADAALGITVGPGQRSLAYVERHRRRDELLRSAAEKFWPGANKSVQARELHVGISRYHDTAWRLDRDPDECPTRLLGTKQEMFWQILKAVDAVLAAETIREILGAS